MLMMVSDEGKKNIESYAQADVYKRQFYTRIGTKVLFRINVDHSSAGRRCTWIVTMTYAMF